MRIEKTEVWITCDRSLQLNDGRAIRGFFGKMYKNIPEFHGHRGNKLIYKHPLIQYKIFGGSALVVGLKEGSYLLKAVPTIDNLEIYHRKYPILRQIKNNDDVLFGLTNDMISYSFLTPWIGLNKENYESYLNLQKKSQSVTRLLEKVLIGNILSVSKSIGYVVEGNVQVRAKLKRNGSIDVKNGVELITFQGEFEMNFLIPDFWGIGKFSSRGYGTVRYNKEGRTQWQNQ